jgi:hypothetical protein
MSYSTELWSYAYLQSTFVCEKQRNIANRAKSVVGGEVQKMHHFISNSPWADQPIINQLQHDVDQLIGSSREGGDIVGLRTCLKNTKLGV